MKLIKSLGNSGFSLRCLDINIIYPTQNPDRKHIPDLLKKKRKGNPHIILIIHIQQEGFN